MESNQDTLAFALSDKQRAIVTVSVMLSAIMVLLDMTIANVALPNMMGALSATSDQITWVLTSYSMAEAIFIPLASFLALKFGVRNLLLLSVAGFVLTSTLCGQADSMMEMVTFRILQGAFGASVIPLSQSVMLQIYPPNERGKAMAIFSIGILLGPILGPVLGGVITEHMSWRWIFYVNIPTGLLCLSLLFLFVKLDGRGSTSIDWIMIFSMAIGIGLLQMVLDRGNQENWFTSNLIVFSSIISAIAIVFFVTRSFMTKGNIAPVWLLKDRNLSLSCLVISIFAMGLFGVTQLKPMLMRELLNYPTDTAGFMMAPSGVAAAIVLISIARIIDKLDARLLIFIGFVLNIISIYLLTLYSIQIDEYWIQVPSIIQGAGMGLVFAPLSQLAYSTLSQQDSVGGAVVFNLCRTIGSSFGISLINTYFSQTEQREWHALGSEIARSNPILQQQAQVHDVSIVDPQFLAQVQSLLQQQSSMLAFVHCFGLIMVVYIFTIPLIALFKAKKITI